MQDEVIDTNNIKIVVLGAEGVGKSSIINQLCDRQFDLEIKSTTCYKIDNAEYIINDQSYNLSFWDCDVKKVFYCFNQAFYRGSLFAFLVVDATCTDQLRSTIQFWDQECEDYNVFTKYVLVNKMDLVDDIEVMNCNKTISIGQMNEDEDHSHIQMINQNQNQIDQKEEIKLMFSNLELNTQCFFGSAKKKEMGYKDFLIKLIKDNNIFNLQKADSDRRIQKNRQNESSIRQSLPIESQRKSSEQIKCNVY
ncbi:unnamed protein product (macronuclear) [Paramecium tetraurelia]|uniref:Uncharacterized protein n=1 Tax=Paramecium tetraurelia TaxID=5888 RepID=A0BJC1_PARTE|nr:uncharacterized protein GSPATT00005011001 [Paramecium tetraurelia]CAK58638.1 unnamed protein product [Paramecium tetraurelia]|eukprot:XP_001426036.1 hypothetical protein (macronuclear) [Paramecium tetraurelia strain d4-2]